MILISVGLEDGQSDHPSSSSLVTYLGQLIFRLSRHMLVGYTAQGPRDETQSAAVFSVIVWKPLHLVFPAANDSPPTQRRDLEFKFSNLRFFES